VLTASNFSKVLAKGEGKVRKSLMLDMAAEALSGQPQEQFSNQWTDHGTQTEPEARANYELLSGNTVRQIGFAYLDRHKLIGCSPDGLVDPDGLIEIKCPKPKTHIEYILAGKVPSEYVAQVQGALWVTGRAWCDFVSYCPSIRDNPMMLVRVEPNADYIAKLVDECGTFLVELDELITRIKNA
jgi:hypothetical protein